MDWSTARGCSNPDHRLTVPGPPLVPLAALDIMSTSPGDGMYETRVRHLQNTLQQSPYDALALIPGASMAYLTGISFHLMERPTLLLLPAIGVPALIHPELESEKASSIPFDTAMFPYPEDPASVPAAVAQAIKALGIARGKVAVEPLGMRYREATLLREAAPSLTLEGADDLTASLRIIKDPEELGAMRAAVQIAESALEATLPKVRIGMTERELAAELVVQLLHAGSQAELPFQPIVAVGPNSALPHATVSERQLSPGDLLLIDWGARVDGYCSDITRTFALTELDDELKEIYEAVRQANEAGRNAIGPDTPCAAVDRATRDVIEAAGYGPRFLHRTGHGLGLEAHEPPYISAENDLALSPGMTFTVEPGIYLPGRGGVRIEDDVVVTEEGSESLTSFPRDLQILE